MGWDGRDGITNWRFQARRHEMQAGQRLTWAREEEGEQLKVGVRTNAQCPFRKVLALYRRVAVAVHGSLTVCCMWVHGLQATCAPPPVCIWAVHACVQFAERNFHAALGHRMVSILRP